MYYLTSAPVYTRRWAVRQQAERTLPLNIHDEGEAFVLTVLVPGLKDEDLNIQILDDTLSIEGQYAQHEGEYLLSELPAGSFRRALRLPSPLDADKAEAHIENGVLTLRVPKAESARPRIIKVASR
jgi:HSP20 family protein